ncbi:alpha/beta hydrolase [Mucilaginibacter sp.]|uniref:alpha/beta fold hydrolase n=1 Tax=Mucilaginibacter sp. TaxID=1882438 RepID=UPI0025CDDAE4|nr:alpha/beta hydrolase [Mucilaginibacter sp.]
MVYLIMQNLLNRFIKTTAFILIAMTTVNKTQGQETGRYANVNGIKMYYEIHGSGQPLVLIHGGGSTITTSFGKILPMLSKTHQVIAVELQAHGHTTDRDAPVSFEQDADDVAELLKQLNVTGADILGFSNGGNTAMQIAIRHPERVRKLVLASAFYKREGMYSWLWEGMKHARLEDMPRIYQEVYLSIPGNTQAGLQNMHDKDAKRMQNFKDWESDVIKSIQAPALIVIGDQDVVRPEHAVEMYRLLPHGRLSIFPDNHGSYMGEIMSPNADSKVPELFVAMLNEYLAAPMPGVK